MMKTEALEAAIAGLASFEDAAVAKAELHKLTVVAGIAEEFLIEEERQGIGGHSAPRSATKYRDWFKADEDGFLLCMRLRFALGMEFPEDVKDIVPGLLAQWSLDPVSG